MHASLESILSPTARSLLALNEPQAYAALVVEGSGSNDAQPILAGLSTGDVFGVPVVRNDDEARCALAALWLWHDHLDRAHTIVQAIDTPSGSWWHAIMHRREGDFGNSSYWYARAAGHPAIMEFERVGRDGLRETKADSIVDLAHRAHALSADDPIRTRAIELQRLEWRVLFEHACRAATSRAHDTLR